MHLECASAAVHSSSTHVYYDICISRNVRWASVKVAEGFHGTVIMHVKHLRSWVIQAQRCLCLYGREVWEVC